MASFRWLHLTDLHWGMGGQKWLWPTLEQKFFADIRRLHQECGPWDLVLFTGDLVQRGSAAEFQELDKVLGKLWTVIGECGSNPVFLAVPGNHDLVRPDPRDPAVRLLRQWTPDIQEEFWAEPGCPYRLTVGKAFEAYVNWWNSNKRRPATFRPGLLPGEFSATIEKDGAKLGIVGLNTTFLQLTGGDYEGKLAMHASQFQEACGGDGPDWAADHHACLLLTHQPPEWLNDDSRRTFAAEIADAGRFALHLFGHMHNPLTKSVAIGGGAVRSTCQGRALFGLEYFGEAGTEVQRSHGYAAGRIEVLDEPTGAWTLWPRVAQLGQDGSWKIVPDQSYTLVDHVHTNPVPFPLLKRLEAGSDIGRELMRIREEMRAAGVAFVRELRPILWRIDGLVQALPPGDALWRAARALQEDILKAMSAEKPLGGFRRQ